MARELARLFVSLGLEDKELQANLNKIQKNLTTYGVALAGMGAAITGSLTAMAVSWGKSGEEIAKMSQKTGMSAKTLSE